MKDQSNTIRILFLVGAILISNLAMILVLASLLFIANIGISSWHFPVSIILTSLLYFYVAKSFYKDIRIFLKAICICIGTTIISIVIALNFYDLSADGQTYHMETISLLKNGWNPFENLLPQKNYLYLYINHYPKGLEIPQSTIYSTIGRIEAGKSTNLILLVATFCLSLSFLLSLNRLSIYKCILISLFATLNPIIVNQLLTTYVDGPMALLLLSFLIISIASIKAPSLYNLILLASIIIITANLKFTSLVYIVIFTMAFIGWVFFTKNKVLLRRVLYTTILSGSFAILIVGFHPYVINTVDFKHPFYPLMGSEKVDIITHNIPKGLEKKGAASRFFISLFAHTDNMMNDIERDIVLKIPFTFNKTDILSAPKVDTRIAGFGPLFSGIIILSILLFSIFLLGSRDFKIIRPFLYIIIIILFSVIIMPDSWWARYIPQLWLIPIIILFIFESYEKHATKASQVLKYIVYITIIVNICFTFIGLGWNFMMTSLVNDQMKRLKVSNKPIEVQWDICSTNYIRFQENNIPFVETDLENRKDIEFIVRSHSLVAIDSTVNLPKSNFIRWAEKYEQPAEKR